MLCFFFSSRRRHTRYWRDWSSDVCSSDLAYNLTYEPNTPMAVKKRLGHFEPVTEELELEMLHHARSRLAAAGYRGYEVSNYALPGEACRHNLVYWTGGNYIGLGPSAASHVEGWRWRN